MENRTSKEVLWDNLVRLMESRYGKVNLTTLAKEAGIGAATMTRLRKQETSAGVDVVDKLAAAFKLQAWQLLVPGLDPAQLPSLGGDASEWPMRKVSKKDFLDLSAQNRLFAEGYLRKAIDDLREAEASTLATTS